MNMSSVPLLRQAPKDGVLQSTVLISGAGPVGCALALQLARHAPEPARIVLRGVFAQKMPGKAAARGTSPSPRTLALNQGSCALLDGLGVALAGAEILTVHVSQKGRLGRTLIDCADVSQPRLGRVVEYADLVSRLQAAVLDCGVTVQRLPSDKFSDKPSDNPDMLAHVLHVVSDGQPARHVQRPYDQHAVLAVVQASRPRAQWAFERFTREGPLALLPHPAGAITGTAARADLYSLVWCCPPDRAQRRQSCDSSAFEAALQAQFGERLGRLALVSPRLCVPLALSASPQWTGGRRVVIGNAAQTLHPVAGQGLNLALRDVAQLAQALRPWLHQLSNPSSNQPDTALTPLLQRFQQKRMADRWLTVGITDLLPRVFTTGNALVEHACGLALTGLDASARLRLPLARHLLQGLRS